MAERDPWNRHLAVGRRGEGCSQAQAGDSRFSPPSPPHPTPPQSSSSQHLDSTHPVASGGFAGSALAKGGGQEGRGWWAGGGGYRRGAEIAHPFPTSCGLPGLAGLGLLAGGQAGRQRWNNEAERAGPRSDLCQPERRLRRGAAWESPKAAVLIFIWGLGGEFGKKGSKVVVSSLPPHPDLVPHSGQP